jgi:hypothetical protein
MSTPADQLFLDAMERDCHPRDYVRAVLEYHQRRYRAREPHAAVARELQQLEAALELVRASQGERLPEGAV